MCILEGEFISCHQGHPTMHKKHPIDTKDFAERLLNNFKEATLILGEDLYIHKVNRVLCKYFRMDPEDIVGHHISVLVKNQCATQEVLSFVDDILSPASPPTAQRRLRYDDDETGRRNLSVRGRRIDDLPLILMTIDDVTDRLCNDHSRGETFNQLELLAKASSDIIYCMSPDWSEIKHLSGRDFIADPKEKSINWIDRFIRPEDQAGVLKAIKKTIRHKEIFELTHQTPCSDVIPCWTFSRVIPILNDKGELVEWMGMAKDITQNISTEKRLQEQEEKFRTLAELSPEAILVNVEHRWVYANKAAADLLGIKNPEEVVGLDIVEVISPEYHTLVRERINTVCNNNFEMFPLECQWKRLDGTPIDVQIIAGPTSWQGLPACQILVHNISARKQIEHALKASKENLQQLADAMPQLVWTANPDGEPTYFNERYREFEGFEVYPNGRWKWISVIHPDDVEKTLNTWSRSFTSGSNFHIEHRLKCKDASFVWYLTRATPIRDQTGEIVKWIGTSTNIDKLKNVEIKLGEATKSAVKANLAKREFLSHMSHEIRTPMTVFLGAIEHLQEIDDDPEHNELLELAENASNHLRNLIDDILDFSRIEAGEIQLKKNPFDLRDWLDDVVMMFHASAKEKNLKLSFKISKKVPSIVIGDSFRLKQILSNLMANALKFTPEGEVKINVTVRDSLLAFAVADTGIGIPEEKQGKLFKAFSQVDSFSHRRYRGTGLGLAISRELVTLMGGHIGVRSSEDAGSEFSFTVPLEIPAPADQPVNVACPDAVAGTCPACSILLAEDDEMIQILIRKRLLSWGWQVDVAASGPECLEKWRTGEFDVILMDLQMPGMDGMETTRHIRREESGKKESVKIIGLTAWAEKQTRELCLQIGMDNFLTKPVRFEDLQEAILDCLST